jgi:hypothetical protein
LRNFDLASVQARIRSLRSLAVIALVLDSTGTTLSAQSFLAASLGR